MSHPAGTRIGNYEILAPLGAGGMGEVYRARDTRLDRDVAIKSLSQAFATDRERLARIEREAKLLASLNHPNIAAIYGLEDVSGAPHLVLEFVDGETLEQRLRRGALSVTETLEVGAQIAAAIEAAHERGIVHRDLKPGNVMLARAGAVKVLDFGLSKAALVSESESQSTSASPTAAMGATGEGLVLGTAPYMSPEQARGKPVDRRTDVWALGCILFECLSGQRTFAGETVSDVIARIIEREPDWQRLPASTPGRLRELIQRCLTKDAGGRPRDIGDLRLELIAIDQNRSAQDHAAASSERPSLAVLYFENLTKDPDSEYFCSGITEDILTDLQKIKGLRVASRNAVRRYRGASPDLAKVASELNVRAVLEGTVRRAGDRVRITTQLVNASDGFQLWAERYDRTLQDVFAVQEEIASSIAEALRVTLTPVEAEKLGQTRPDDARAYDLYLKGRQEYGKYRAESLRLALDLFRQAIQVDSNYALAWAGIADCYGQLMQWRITQDVEEAGRLGLEAARRAIEIDPALPEGYKAEALVLGQTGDYDGSRAANTKAIQADPNFTPALINLAVDCVARADLAGAERIFHRVLEVDPQEPFTTLWSGFHRIYTDRYDEAIAFASRLRELSSEAVYVTEGHTVTLWAHVLRGDLTSAREVWEEARKADVPRANLQVLEAFLAVNAGKKDEAKRLIAEAEIATTLGGGDMILLACVAAQVGEVDHAVQILSYGGDQLRPISVRLLAALHPLVDHPALAPRRWDCTLVWPLEAPKIDIVRYRFFKEVRIETGLPQGSDIWAK